jgi:nitrite reductase/ring-hydroxylating ferredoxin subunit
MEKNCMGNCDHNHQELSRKALLGSVAAVLTGIGLSTLGATAAEAATKYKVTLAKNIPVGSAKSFSVKGRPVLITQPRKGVYRAFKGQCTHQAVNLQTQAIQGGNVMCYEHGATFSADNGTVQSGPANRSLTKYKAVKTGNYIYVTI